MFKCSKCNREAKTKAGLSSHERSCDGNGTKRSRSIDRNSSYVIENSENMSKKEIHRAKLKMIWKDENYRDKQKNKIYYGNPSDPVKMEEKRIKLRNAINERYKNGWNPRAGRCKKIKYLSEIAGEVSVDGSWELAVCKFLDRNKINWRRNKIRFNYLDSKGKERTYCPDFYLIESETYIEVKGYVTNLDRIKWEQFTAPLEIWNKQVLIDKGILESKGNRDSPTPAKRSAH
jgi:hypothetical protein